MHCWVGLVLGLTLGLWFQVLQPTRCHGPYQHPKLAWNAAATTIALEARIQLRVSFTDYTTNGQKVAVSWSGVEAPSPLDLIALYVPAHPVDLWRVVPIHFANASAAATSHLTNGSGQATFTMYNMRQSFGFKFVKGGPFRPRVVAEAPPIHNRIPHAPTGGHLALHTDQRSVVVQWVSGQAAAQKVQWAAEAPSPFTAASQLGEGVQRRMAVQQGTGAVWGGWQGECNSETDTYSAADMCGFPANATGWLHPGHLHAAIIPAAELRPGQRYWYRFGSKGDGWSSVFSFLAPQGPGCLLPAPRLQLPAASEHIEAGWAAGRARRKLQVQPIHMHPAAISQQGATAQGVQSTAAAAAAATAAATAVGAAAAAVETAEDACRLVFLAFNDVAQVNPILFNNPWAGGLHFAEGYGQNSSRLAARLGSDGTDGEVDAHLALMVGDLAYAVGFGADWDIFQQQFEAAFTRWPMAVGTGNHEADWPGTGDAFDNQSYDSGGECNVPFQRRWFSPANAQGDPRKSYYSFSQGPVHFLVLDSERPSGPDTPQGRFVAADLAAVDRAVTPWVVVALHRMMVAPATWRHSLLGDLDNMERLQADYELLFQHHQVDVVIQGHEHAYARTCPLFQWTCTSQPLSQHAPQQSTDVLRSRAQQQQWQDTAHDESAVETYAAPAGGPVYLLAGNAGAGFTHGFPEVLQEWVRYGQQERNGYLRATATHTDLLVESVDAATGQVFDAVRLVR